MARELAKLGPGWHYLHAVEVGDRGSDIDHVVIGPPGVITINTKRHPRGKAWVGERMVMINGQKTDYLHNSRFEAKRAAKLLSSECGKPIEARAAIVFVDLDNYNVKQMPTDVHVTTRRRLVGWLRSLPAVAPPETRPVRPAPVTREMDHDHCQDRHVGPGKSGSEPFVVKFGQCAAGWIMASQSVVGRRREFLRAPFRGTHQTVHRGRRCRRYERGGRRIGDFGEERSL